MISELHVRDAKRTPVPWWPDVPWLQALPDQKLTFGLGVTVLFGPNGSGKSTVLTALARLFHVAQGGVPVMTDTSVAALWRRERDDSTSWFADGLDIRHDGNVAGHFDAEHRAGLVGGMAGFDYDFMDDAMMNIQGRRVSAGQSHLARLNALFSRPPATRSGVEDRCKHRKDVHVKACRAFLEPNTLSGLSTTLLDEPERSLAIPLRRDLWRLILLASTKMQVIVATHDPFALMLPEGAVTFVEPVPGYVDKCMRALTDVADFKPLGRK